MDFNANFRFLGDVDVKPLREKVLSIGEDIWLSDTFRQTRYPVHQQTQTLYLIFDKDGRYSNPTRQPLCHALQCQLAPILVDVAKLFEDGSYPLKALVVKLRSGGVIAKHRDKGATLSYVHRIHIPLVTTAYVRFQVGSESVGMQAGEIWEINNCREHSVNNEGDQDRLHLILDWVTPTLSKKYLRYQVESLNQGMNGDYQGGL